MHEHGRWKYLRAIASSGSPSSDTSSTSGFRPVQVSWATTVAPAVLDDVEHFFRAVRHRDAGHQDPRPARRIGGHGLGLGEDPLVGRRDPPGCPRSGSSPPGLRDPVRPFPARRATARRSLALAVHQADGLPQTIVGDRPSRSAPPAAGAGRDLGHPVAKARLVVRLLGQLEDVHGFDGRPGARTSSFFRRTSSRRRRGRSSRRGGWPFPGRSRSST